MNKFLYIIFLFQGISFAQELCEPINLKTIPTNNSMTFQWKDVNVKNKESLFLECFENCEIPQSTTISHLIDNGNGGWFRGQDSQFYCTFGEDCNLNIGGAGYAAAAYWSSSGTAIDSRMSFGPFEIPENVLITLEFLESYYYPNNQTDPNTVEVSLDSGISWNTIYTSNPNIIESSWKNSVINLSDFGGESIHIGFRYTCSQGNSEAWLIDHIEINLNNIENSLQDNQFSQYPNRLLNFNSEQRLVQINDYRENNFAKYLIDIDLNSTVTKKLPSGKIKATSKKIDFQIPYMNSYVPRVSISSASQYRNCSDPENQSEVAIVVTNGQYPDEISWTISDSSGQNILNGGAPFDTVLCLQNSFYSLTSFDSYNDGWDGSYLSITDASSSISYILYTLEDGGEENRIFFVGPYYGCTDPNADNYDEYANIDDGSCEYTPCGLNEIYLYCSPGAWPSEVTWSVEDSLGNFIAAGTPGEVQTVCIPNGYYRVNGYDSFGDGWNGATFTAIDTSGNILVALTFEIGNYAYDYFYAGPKYGCTDPNADNYDAEATADDGSCFFRDCFDNQRYVIYLDGDSVGSTQLDFFLFPNLANGIQYNFGVEAVYDEGRSIISSISSVPWNNVSFEPLQIEFDTLSSSSFIFDEISFLVDPSVAYTTPFFISGPKAFTPDTESSIFQSDFNSENLTNMFDPSGVFGGLWQVGDQSASTEYLDYGNSLDSSTFAYINDDAIGTGSISNAYLITEEIQINSSDRVFVTFDLYFPQLGGSCTDAGAEINGDGFGEDLFFKISSDYGETWSYVDSTLGGYPNWVSRMYEITEELNGFTSFIAAINYSDCNGNWSYGVGIDNFAIHLASNDDILSINPYAGWVDINSPMKVHISMPNDNTQYDNTSLQLFAAFESLDIPVQYGITLDIKKENLINPSKFALHQNYPNPFNPSTIITFEIQNDEFVELSIFNIKGQKVKTILQGHKNQGIHKAHWNGFSDSGIPMPAGLYFYEIKTENFRDTKKMILLK